MANEAVVDQPEVIRVDSPGATALQARIVTGSGGALPDLSDAWGACLDACPPEQHLFSHAWYAEWMRVYGSRPPWTGDSCVVIAEDAAGRPRALMPLAYRRAHGLRYLSLAGYYQPLRTFPCVPADADAACAVILDALLHRVRGWDVLRFGPVDDAAPERAALLRALGAAARRRVTIPRGRTVVSPVHDSFAPHAASKSIKRIESYARRFAREEGAAIRHFHAPDAATAEAMFRDLGEIERGSWLARKEGDLRFAGDHDQDFWRRVTAASLSPGGHLDVWVASMRGRPIAFRVVLSAGKADYMIANQYDEAFADLRPGWILSLEHLRVAVARGTRFIDAAPGDFHYKGRLGGEEAQMRTDELIFHNSPGGWALVSLVGGLRLAREHLEKRAWGRPLASRLPRL